MKNRIQQLKVYKTLESSSRNSAIDIFRAFAILAVIVYHFFEKLFPFGYLGVDLFFVISGFLVGGILLKEFEAKGTINYFKFFISRGFKIWPSYYIFLFIGNALAYFFYHKTEPSYYIPLNDSIRYFLFIKNFIGTQYHWCFEHLWSLCVEEHFYLIIPLFFLLLGFIQKQIKIQNHYIQFIGIEVIIIFGIIIRYILYKYYSRSINMYECSFVRIDELAWGLLLSFIINRYGKSLSSLKNAKLFSVFGILLFCAILKTATDYSFSNLKQIVHFTLIPISFFFIILGVYFSDFSKFIGLRVIAYFSYNWYLWHTLFVKIIKMNIAETYLGFSIYMIITFIISIIFTIFIEEYFLNLRLKFFKKFPL